MSDSKVALTELLQELYQEQERTLNDRFQRSLSFQDGFFDRWERAQRLRFGEGASIYNSTMVLGDVYVGIKTWVGPFVVLDGSGGGCKIGDYCCISAGVHIYTHDSVLWSLSGGKKEYHKAGVVIGNNTYVGAQSVIKAGVKIGSCCVIGANSFVNQSVEDYLIVAGSPAKVIGRVVVEGEDIRLVYE